MIGAREEGMFRRLGTLVRLGTGLAQALAHIRGFDELRGRLNWKQDADRSFQLLREKNDELAEDLSPWFTDNFITLLFRDGVELRTLAFLSTIAQLADMETPMLSVLAFVAADGTKQEFLLA